MADTDVRRVLQDMGIADASRIKVAITDVDGILRGKYLHRDKFMAIAESGFAFCNVVFGWDSADVCYDNSTYTGWHSGYPDALVRLDLSTGRRIPWEGNVPFFLGDFQNADGTPLAVCPRQLLKGVLARLQKAGFEARCGFEFEFFNFRESPQSLAGRNHQQPEPMTPGMFGYSLLRMAEHRSYFAAIMEDLQAFDVPIEGLHTETGPGVLEAAILYSDALKAADRAVLFKTSTKEIARRFGVMASFMAKWSASLPGCSGHMHQSLWRGEENAFFADGDPHKMSATFRHYIAGIARALPDILPLLAPTVNSYKRLVDGFWAPTRVTWGIDNRTVALRVLPGSAKSTRLEVRVGGSDINPYLALAATLAAGLHGIEQEMELMPATEGSGYANASATRLPRTLQEATARLSDSALAHELLGDTFVDHFVKTREWEWRQFQDAVTDWELRRYFEII